MSKWQNVMLLSLLFFSVLMTSPAHGCRKKNQEKLNMHQPENQDDLDVAAFEEAIMKHQKIENYVIQYVNTIFDETFEAAIMEHQQIENYVTQYVNTIFDDTVENAKTNYEFFLAVVEEFVEKATKTEIFKLIKKEMMLIVLKYLDAADLIECFFLDKDMKQVLTLFFQTLLHNAKDITPLFQKQKKTSTTMFPNYLSTMIMKSILDDYKSILDDVPESILDDEFEDSHGRPKIIPKTNQIISVQLQYYTYFHRFLHTYTKFRRLWLADMTSTLQLIYPDSLLSLNLDIDNHERSIIFYDLHVNSTLTIFHIAESSESYTMTRIEKFQYFVFESGLSGINSDAFVSAVPQFFVTLDDTHKKRFYSIDNIFAIIMFENIPMFFLRDHDQIYFSDWINTNDDLNADPRELHTNQKTNLYRTDECSIEYIQNQLNKKYTIK